MSRSQQLYRLQQLDTKIDRAQARVEEIEAMLGKDEVLQKAVHQEKVKKHFLEEKRKSLKKAAHEVEAQELEIERKTSQLYGGRVTNPKELEDLQQKVDSLQRYLDVLEERQLEAMLEADEAQEAHDKASQELRKVRTERKTLHKELKAEKEILESKIEDQRAKRPDYLPEIRPEDLKLYETTRKSRAGIAVAAVDDQSCAACGTRIPSAIHQIANSPSQLTQCSTCKRILHGR
ncbi:MAG: hypothetical protein MAG431_02390 [Chloroflexi bacterium]|nr:hypothetical protein [Chloroflexota bacterium]